MTVNPLARTPSQSPSIAKKPTEICHADYSRIEGHVCWEFFPISPVINLLCHQKTDKLKKSCIVICFIHCGQRRRATTWGILLFLQVSPTHIAFHFYNIKGYDHIWPVTINFTRLFSLFIDIRIRAFPETKTLFSQETQSTQYNSVLCEPEGGNDIRNHWCQGFKDHTFLVFRAGAEISQQGSKPAENGPTAQLINHNDVKVERNILKTHQLKIWIYYY